MNRANERWQELWDQLSASSIPNNENRIFFLADVFFSCGKIPQISLGEASFFRSYTKSVKKHTRSEVHPQSRRLKTDHHEQMSGALVSLINLLKLFTEMLVIEHKQHSVSCFFFFFLQDFTHFMSILKVISYFFTLIF